MWKWTLRILGGIALILILTWMMNMWVSPRIGFLRNPVLSRANDRALEKNDLMRVSDLFLGRTSFFLEELIMDGSSIESIQIQDGSLRLDVSPDFETYTPQIVGGTTDSGVTLLIFQANVRSKNSGLGSIKGYCPKPKERQWNNIHWFAEPPMNFEFQLKDFQTILKASGGGGTNNLGTVRSTYPIKVVEED